MKSVETEARVKLSPILRLCPRIIVFRPFVNQLPKLDVAGSTPVARSLLTARNGAAFSCCLEMTQLEVQLKRLDFRIRRNRSVVAEAFEAAFCC